MTIRPEVLPFIVFVGLVFALHVLVLRWRGRAWRKGVRICGIAAVVCAGYLLYFFRDPERVAPTDADAVVAGADGTVTSVTEVFEEKRFNMRCVRISIFLSLLDVHVNRSPIEGKATFIGYFPGKRLFTFQEKSSEVNQHNKILIEGQGTGCLVHQIVGPVCRRVVYWPSHDGVADLKRGERIGMMKFGSRLDMYLPAEHVEVVVKPGTKVRAGETVVARVRKRNERGSLAGPEPEGDEAEEEKRIIR